MTKYTADDFANARFAEHEDGRRAVRTSTPVAPWIMEMRNGPGHCAKDSEMAAFGWVPVPSKPTITDSQLEEACGVWYESDDFLMGFMAGYEKAGGTTIDDPEPTNTEKLADILVESFNGMEFDLEDSFREIAAVLDRHGVTAPNVKGN
jgi:hypothetical protein